MAYSRLVYTFAFYFSILGSRNLSIYFFRKRPIHRLQRVRSKVYSRLYSKDKYERPIPRSEFLTRVGAMLQAEEELHSSHQVRSYFWHIMLILQYQLLENYVFSQLL